MCEQCLPPASGWPDPESAIRACPRFKELGEPTVAWLTDMVEPGQADHEPAKPKRRSSRLLIKLLAGLTVFAAVVTEAVGDFYGFYRGEFRNGESLSLMVFGCFLLLLVLYLAPITNDD